MASGGFRPVSGLAAIIGAFPLIAIAIPFYLYFQNTGQLDTVIFTMWGAEMTGGFVALAVAGVVLPLEIAKASDTGMKGLIDTGLSIFLFCFMWLCFASAMNAEFRSPYWVILCLIQTGDALGGTVVTIVAARRDFGTGSA